MTTYPTPANLKPKRPRGRPKLQGGRRIMVLLDPPTIAAASELGRDPPRRRGNVSLGIRRKFSTGKLARDQSK